MYSNNAKIYESGISLSAKSALWPLPDAVPFDKGSQIVKDANSIFSEKIFASSRQPIDLGETHIQFPREEFYILRMPIRYKYVWSLPVELAFLGDVLHKATSFQQSAFGTFLYPYVYLTIRHGDQKEFGTNVWHNDGFQGNVKARHIGEISYIWTSDGGTEWAEDPVNVPDTFDPAKHNFFSVLEKIDFQQVKRSKPKSLTCFDSYTIHRKNTNPGKRTMLRITFSNIEIKDSNYTPNPAFKLSYSKPEPRDTLSSFT